jgi:hypothetical protein
VRGWQAGRRLGAATLLLGFACAGAASAEPIDAFEAEARRVLQDSSLQNSRPDQPRHEPRAADSAARVDEGRAPAVRVSGEAVSFASVVLWMLVAVLVIALLAALWRGASEHLALRGTAARSGLGDEKKGPQSASAGPARSWQELAAQGRHSEAVHALLLEALQRLDIAAREGRALTSREVLSRARLTAERRAALEELIVSVERSLFGGAALGSADYERCLGALQRFGYG